MMRRHGSPVGAVLAVVAIGAGFAFASCGDRKPASEPKSAEQAITRFSPAHVDNSFEALNKAASGDKVALRNAALAHLGDKDPNVHYAALYGLVLAADENGGANELVAMLGSAVADERLLSAGKLAGLGDKRALPVLIAALDNPERLSYRHPPQRAFEFAKTQLLWFTKQDLGLKSAITQDQIAASKLAWEQWWRSAGPALRFDRQTRRFVQ
jgi:hypothetical protein